MTAVLASVVLVVLTVFLLAALGRTAPGRSSATPLAPRTLLGDVREGVDLIARLNGRVHPRT